MQTRLLDLLFGRVTFSLDHEKTLLASSQSVRSAVPTIASLRGALPLNDEVVVGQVVLPTVPDARRLPHFLAAALFDPAPDLVEVLEVPRTLGKCLQEALLVDHVADRVVLGDCPQVDAHARNQRTVAVDVELHVPLLVDLEHLQTLPAEGAVEVGLDVDLAAEQHVELLGAVGLRQHLVGRVQLLDQLCGDAALEALGPMAEEEDAVLDELQLTVADHF